MKAMSAVFVIGSVISAATAIIPAEAVRAFTPFAVLSTGVLSLAYWLVAVDHTPARSDASVQARKAA